METNILKLFGSVDVKITPDFCSLYFQASLQCSSVKDSHELNCCRPGYYNVQCADLHGLKTFAKITKNLVCEVTPSNVECTPCSLFCIHRFEPWRAPFVNNGHITDRAAAISLRQAKIF